MKFAHIDVALLRPDPENPRSVVSRDSIKSLAASIAEVGLLNPITVRAADDGTYMIVSGHRRYAALLTLKHTGDTPCLVREDVDVEGAADTQGDALAQLIENLQREDLRPVDEAKGLFRLVGLGMRQKDMPKVLNRSAQWVKDRLSLLELPADAQAKVNDGTVSIEDALKLLALKEAAVDAETGALDGERFTKLVDGVVTKMKGSYYHTGTLVGDVLSKDRKAKAQAAKRAEAKEYGWAAKFSDHDNTVPKGCQRLVPPDHVRDGQTLNVAKHKDEPCHGVWFTHSYGHGTGDGFYNREIAVCTDPARHRDGGPSKLKWRAKQAPKKEREAQAAADERDQAIAASRLHRVAFAVDAVRKVPAKAGLLMTILRVFVDEVVFHHDYYAAGPYVHIAQLLGLAEATQHKDVHKTALRSYLEEGGDTALLRVAWAYLLVDALADTGAGSWDTERIEAGFRLLIEAGYEPDEVGLAALEAIAAKRAEAEAALQDEYVQLLAWLQSTTTGADLEGCMAALDKRDTTAKKVELLQGWKANAKTTSRKDDLLAEVLKLTGDTEQYRALKARVDNANGHLDEVLDAIDGWLDSNDVGDDDEPLAIEAEAVEAMTAWVDEAFRDDVDDELEEMAEGEVEVG